MTADPITHSSNLAVQPTAPCVTELAAAQRHLDTQSACHSVLAFLGVVVIAGCALSASDPVSAVYTEGSPPPSSVASPPGFRVSPSRAYAIARESHRLSLKHIWHIYADSRYYYVHDAFLGSGARRARATGLRIDGLTGKMVLR